jgi:hypothetical protein
MSTHQPDRSISRRGALAILVVAVAFIATSTGGLITSAQDATPRDEASHSIVGTWIIDTINATDTDSPEIGMFLADGGALGLGANRVAGGSWEVVDDRTVMLTLVTVFDQAGVGGYVVVRGLHVLDDAGDAWKCACTFTVVGADGTVLDSGQAPASATRLPVQGPDAVGTPLSEVPIWTPVQPDSATPAT